MASQEVINFLVKHYVESDLIIYGAAREEFFQQNPELTDVDALVSNPVLKQQREFIDDGCQVGTLIDLETEYFTPGVVNPAENGLNLNYKLFCDEIRASLGVKVEEGNIEVSNKEAMGLAWKSAFVEVVDASDLYMESLAGLSKLSQIYESHRIFNLEDLPLVGEFVALVCKKELDHFNAIYNGYEGVEDDFLKAGHKAGKYLDDNLFDLRENMRERNTTAFCVGFLPGENIPTVIYGSSVTSLMQSVALDYGSKEDPSVGDNISQFCFVYESADNRTSQYLEKACKEIQDEQTPSYPEGSLGELGMIKGLGEVYLSQNMHLYQNYPGDFIAVRCKPDGEITTRVGDSLEEMTNLLSGEFGDKESEFVISRITRDERDPKYSVEDLLALSGTVVMDSGLYITANINELYQQYPGQVVGVRKRYGEEGLNPHVVVASDLSSLHDKLQERFPHTWTLFSTQELDEYCLNDSE